MDDDLLADDGQFKDDGLDDIDIDEEAALLGLSDDEALQNEQELEYVDEDGNPVDIGENNAELYEIATPEKQSFHSSNNQADDDVLELDLDTELDSFIQEDSELAASRNSPATLSTNDKRYKENLISVSTKKESDKLSIRRKETYHKTESSHEKKNENVFHSQNIRHDNRNNYKNASEFDEESEDESIPDDHRERFKSERSNIITLTPAKRRADIPDTLDSVISVEETAKVQAFLENEQKRKKWKGRGSFREKNSLRSMRSNQNLNTMHSQQAQSSTNSLSTSQESLTAPRKILINPHFRGPRMPPPLTSTQEVYQNQGQQISFTPSNYETQQPSQNFMTNVYSPTNAHQVSLAPPVNYNAPQTNIHYAPSEYVVTQPPPTQMPPPLWQNLPAHTSDTYATIPPPAPPTSLYGEIPMQSSNFTNNYSITSYQDPLYQNSNVAISHTSSYDSSHLVPQVHSLQMYSPASSLSTDLAITTQSHFSTVSHSNFQQNLPQKSYQDKSRQQNCNQTQRNKFNQNRFQRQAEKRNSSANIKAVPVKQARMEHNQRKLNVHVNNSNIREIPLVDNLPNVQKTSKKLQPVVEEEDEETRELRMKIEEQKIIREKILKVKEHRRRLMAAQRLEELKKRKVEQNITSSAKGENASQSIPTKSSEIVLGAKSKISVKERIGIPQKKKIVVVRKKVLQNDKIPTSNESKKPLGVMQRLGVKTNKPQPKVEAPQNNQPQKGSPSIQASLKLGIKQRISQPNPVSSTKTQNLQPPSNTQIVKQNKLPEAKKQITLKNKDKSTNAVKQKQNSPLIQNQKKLGRNDPRFRFQPPQFHQPLNISQQRLPAPRFPGSRGLEPNFPPPFIDHRMRFPPNMGPPMNDMRMPPPHFSENMPPLLQQMGPGKCMPFNRFFPPDVPPNHNAVHFQGPRPGFENFGPRGMDMFYERFPVPSCMNQMPPVRNLYQPSAQPRPLSFPRPRFQNMNIRQKLISTGNQDKRNASNSNVKKNEQIGNVKKDVSKSTPISQPNKDASKTVQPTSTKSAVTNIHSKTPIKSSDQNLQKNVSTELSKVPKTNSVKVENLSSSTNEIQLKKLCSTVGVVENIELLKTERKAIIKFKEPLQALKFQKKYQRFMLDLAMIQVSLLYD